jgi:uncharacterized protein
MPSLFVDTSGWANYFIPTETYNKEAIGYLYQAQKDRHEIVTTNYVIAELVALLGSRHRTSRQVLFQYIDSIKQEPQIELFHVDSVLDSVAWNLCRIDQTKLGH